MIRVPIESVGQPVLCPLCGKQLRLRDAGSAAGATAAQAAPPPAPPPPAQTPPPAPEPEPPPPPTTLFNCPRCGQAMELAEELRGQTLACPACQQQFVLGAPTTAPVPSPAPAPAPVIGSGGGGQITLEPRSREDLLGSQSRILLGRSGPWLIFSAVALFLLAGLLATGVGLAIAVVARAAALDGGDLVAAALLTIVLPGLMAGLLILAAFRMLHYHRAAQAFLAQADRRGLGLLLASLRTWWVVVGGILIMTIAWLVTLAVIWLGAYAHVFTSALKQ
ncbi:MAG: hypothetical protein BIFFINMI_01606 [Phycisphaerae bacterium]|nr:hypothetical protein [Phycisphaerae bacterium]